ncbi:MAG: Molybdopterin synthase catalytic subunit [Phylliscum demangeonii]|nr:MAG: Molybdopterin synthase catalytic subunit [Phylliscum demangeonii]
MADNNDHNNDHDHAHDHAAPAIDLVQHLTLTTRTTLTTTTTTTPTTTTRTTSPATPTTTTHPLTTAAAVPAPPTIYMQLTSAPIQTAAVLERVRRPDAGALVLFAGTTRADARPDDDDDTHTHQPHTHTHQPHTHTHPPETATVRIRSLHYSAYGARAMKTLAAIGREVVVLRSGDDDGDDGGDGGVKAIAMVHRVGRVEVGAESVVIAGGGVAGGRAGAGVV